MLRLSRVLCRLGLHRWWVARIGTGNGGGEICIRSCERCRAKTWTYRAESC